jgi:oxygen-independent coproporphyrinogen-3 oxidase
MFDRQAIMKIDFLKQQIMKQSDTSLGIYIHIPFCRVRCQFCAFYVQTQKEEAVEAFLDGLHLEIHRYSREMGWNNIPVGTVYFGGGTPTVLTDQQLVGILDEIQKKFQVTTDAEISIEAHPGTVTPESLKILRSQGFNRISIGAQSFDDQELLQLGGRSVSRKTRNAVESARQAGFDNLSLDLMYGFPGQTQASWVQTLEATMALKPTHLSCYAFTVEEGSYIYDMVDQGTVSSPDEDMQTSFGNIAVDCLGGAGYEQYEISNFCQPGFSCKHNLRYWQGESYLGFGPSSQSFVGGVRFGNVADLGAYGLTLDQGELPIDHWDALTLQEIQREQIVFGLRTNRGVRHEHIQSLSQKDLEWEMAFQELKDQGLLMEDDVYVRLTRKGVQFADVVAVALI